MAEPSPEHDATIARRTALPRALCLGALLSAVLFALEGCGTRAGAAPPMLNGGAPARPAFPGAEGFGAVTAGGRGGRVIEVTNLNDAGPGSLRAAIAASGPRIVVFRVAGTIRLESALRVVKPYLTIAGQTAPGGGITLANSPRGSRGPLAIKTHDVVVQYIRARPGPSPLDEGAIDAVTISNDRPGNVYRVIVDHCSLSWATDEVCGIYYDAHDITVQWSIIAEGLDCATHTEDCVRQCHSMGMLVGSEGAGNISIHHNLFAHNRHRNPKIRTDGGLVDVVNNVVYNSGFGNGWLSPTYVHGGLGVVKANYIGNYFKPGINTGPATWFIATKLPVQIYVRDNVVPGEVVSSASRGSVVDRAHPAAPVTIQSAIEAYARVLAEAGASRALACSGGFYARRDAADEKLVNEVRTGAGHIIDDPSEVGGWPELSAGVPCTDTDHDTIPDDFERLHGLRPADPSDGPLDPDGNGYTNLEEYLNGIR